MFKVDSTLSNKPFSSITPKTCYSYVHSMIRVKILICVMLHLNTDTAQNVMGDNFNVGDAKTLNTLLVHCSYGKSSSYMTVCLLIYFSSAMFERELAAIVCNIAAWQLPLSWFHTSSRKDWRILPPGL